MTCLIPGHDGAGARSWPTAGADDDHFRFWFRGTCGYESTFHYTSD